MIFDVANDRLAPTLKARNPHPCKARVSLTHMNDSDSHELVASVPKPDLQVKVWNPVISERKKELFWKKVDKSPHPKGCWVWTRPPKNQYGHCGFNIETGMSHYAHRVSYVINVGPIPDGLCVLHTCDNPACVNPSHFFLGTRKDNNSDRNAKGRSNPPKGLQSTGCKRSFLNEEQVREIRKRDISKRGSLVALAREFGVSKCVMFNVVNRRSWKYIT